MDLACGFCPIDEVPASKEFGEVVSKCEILSTFAQRWPEISLLVDHASPVVDVYFLLFLGKASLGSHGLLRPPKSTSSSDLASLV